MVLVPQQRGPVDIEIALQLGPQVLGPGGLDVLLGLGLRSVEGDQISTGACRQQGAADLQTEQIAHAQRAQGEQRDRKPVAVAGCVPALKIVAVYDDMVVCLGHQAAPQVEQLAGRPDPTGLAVGRHDLALQPSDGPSQPSPILLGITSGHDGQQVYGAQQACVRRHQRAELAEPPAYRLRRDALFRRQRQQAGMVDLQIGQPRRIRLPLFVHRPRPEPGERTTVVQNVRSLFDDAPPHHPVLHGPLAVGQVPVLRRETARH